MQTTSDFRSSYYPPVTVPKARIHHPLRPRRTYMLARYYTSGSGRFLQVDPGYDYDMTDPMSFNLYGYVRGNPIMGTDPTGLTDINVIIGRFNETTKSTIGYFEVVGQKKLNGVTLELPWKNNKQNVSRIPSGVYTARLYHSKKHGWVIRLENVPNRTNILVHRGMRPKNTKGCVLIGTYIGGKNKIGDDRTKGNSLRDKFGKFVLNTEISDLANGETTNITVTVTDSHETTLEVSDDSSSNSSWFPKVEEDLNNKYEHAFD